MKIVNEFPVKEQQGTVRPDNKRNYYSHKGLQVSRAYQAPQAPYNSPYNLVRTFQAAAKGAWGGLTVQQKNDWYIFTQQWNNSINAGARAYNPFTAFSTVNHYRQLKGLAIATTPPQVRPNKSWNLIDVKGYSSEEAYVIFKFEVENLPNKNHKVAIHTTKSYPGFPHAYRKSERKYLHGMTSSDVIDVPLKSGQSQYILTDRPERFPENSWFWLEARLLTEEYFPYLRKRYKVVGGESMEVYSVLDLEQWYAPETLVGCTVPGTLGAPAWHLNPTAANWGLWTYGNGSVARFRFPFAVWGNCQKIWVKWTGGGGTYQLKSEWLEVRTDLLEHTETVKATVTDTCPAEEKISELVYDTATWIKDRYYILQCTTINAGNDLFGIKQLMFKSPERAY